MAVHQAPVSPVWPEWLVAREEPEAPLTPEELWVIKMFSAQQFPSQIIPVPSPQQVALAVLEAMVEQVVQAEAPLEP